LRPLFELIRRHVPPPLVETGPFLMLATTLEVDPYLGRILTGRISSGRIQAKSDHQGTTPRRSAH